MRTVAISSACVVLLLCARTHAAMPLTVATCKAMKIDAMRQQCMLSAVQTSPGADDNGRTYSTRELPSPVPPKVDPPAPVMPIVPYINIAPGSSTTIRQR